MRKKMRVVVIENEGEEPSYTMTDEIEGIEDFSIEVSKRDYKKFMKLQRKYQRWQDRLFEFSCLNQM